jgi:hypothetical protein
MIPHVAASCHCCYLTVQNHNTQPSTHAMCVRPFDVVRKPVYNYLCLVCYQRT